MYEQVIPALVEFFTWPAPLYLILGSLAGMLFGVLPGLGGPQVLALLLPLTFAMEPSYAIILLIGAAGAVPCGGSITAILINTPGTPQNAATTFDGFPLTKMGKAGMAIGAAVSSSVLGAIFGAIILTLVLPFGKAIVLAFSYPETFMLALMGLALIAVLSKGQLWKSIIVVGLGLMISTVGLDIATGTPRYTFGSMYLYDGIKLIPVLIGVFGVAEAISLFVAKGAISEKKVNTSLTGVLDGAKAPFRHFGIFLRGSFIGTIIGIIPGVGGSVANFLGYAQAVSTSKDKSQFGKGDIRGIVGAECSNNAKDGGALIPTLIFGIPGSVEYAVLLGALTIHGIQPGPRLLMERGEIILMVIFTLVLSNILVGVLSLFGAKILVRITSIKGVFIAPVVMMLALIGTYATDYHLGDVYVAVIFGLIGYVMIRYEYSRIGLVIAAVLGTVIQSTLNQTLRSMGAQGFVERPISLVFLIITLAVLVIPFLPKKNKRSDGDDLHRPESL